MNNPDSSWKKLVEAARKAPATGDEAAPFGFSTRVAARAFEPRTEGSMAFARLSLRAAAVAFILAVVAVGVNFAAIANAFGGGQQVATDDPIADFVNLDS